MRHQCNKMANGTNWMVCSVCDGRVHLEGCTARIDPTTDCCEARHKMLFEQGRRVGINDSSQPMWDQSQATWWAKGKRLRDEVAH